MKKLGILVLALLVVAACNALAWDETEYASATVSGASSVSGFWYPPGSGTASCSCHAQLWPPNQGVVVTSYIQSYTDYVIGQAAFDDDYTNVRGDLDYVYNSPVYWEISFFTPDASWWTYGVTSLNW